jgi:hypothetical protein
MAVRKRRCPCLGSNLRRMRRHGRTYRDAVGHGKGSPGAVLISPQGRTRRDKTLQWGQIGGIDETSAQNPMMAMPAMIPGKAIASRLCAT